MSRNVAEPSRTNNDFDYSHVLQAAWLIASRAFIERQYDDLEWFDDHTCNCRCPGEDFHSSRTFLKDCRIYLDPNPVPTINCLHESCSAIIEAHNEVLRRWWREAMTGDGLGLDTEQLARLKHDLRAREILATPEQRRRNKERAALADLRVWARDNRWRILKNVWTSTDISADSPTAIPADPRNHWQLVLSRYQSEDTLWIADDVSHSGEWKDGRSFGHCFRQVSQWLVGGGAPGVYICPAVLGEGSARRSNDNVVSRPFMVAESDTLKRDEVGAVFQWIRSQGPRLRFIVDTGGKSLHAWFEAPDENRMKCLHAILPGLGIDPKVLTRSQPVRLPGAINSKSGNPQRLIYCDLLP